MKNCRPIFTAVLVFVALLGIAATSFNMFMDSQVRNTTIYSGFLNVRQFGAVGNGVTDDTAAVAAAYNALSSTDGGMLFFPQGTWKFNLTNTKPNVTIRGSSHMVDVGGSATLASHFIPANTATPLIQVGNDTGRVKGFQIINCTLDGRAGGDYGIYFAGGTTHASMRNCAVTLFKICVRAKGGTTYPCSLVYMDEVHIQASTAAGARGILVEQVSNYPTSWTTAIYYRGSHLQGQASNGYAVEVDSTDLHLEGDYFDLVHAHGFKTTKTYAQLPHFYFTDTTLDGGVSTNVIFESYSTNRYFADQIRMVTSSMNGYWQTSDAVLLAAPSAGVFVDNSISAYPIALGRLQLLATDEDYRGGYWTNHNLYASGGNLFLTEAGVFTMNLGGGRLQPGTDNTTDSGGASTRWKTVRTYKVQSPEVAISASDIDFRAGNTFAKSISGNTTFTFSNATAGDWITVKVTATGAFTATWPTVTWKGGTTPTQTASKSDFYTFYYNGTTYYGSASQNF